MSPLTKVFVFLVTILSIFLVSLVIPIVNQIDDLSEEKELAQSNAESAQLTIDLLRRQNLTQQEKLASINTASNLNQGELERKNNELQTSVNRLELELANEKQSRTQSDAAIEALTNQAEVLSAQSTRLNEALNNAQSTAVLQSSRMSELESRNNELESLNASLNIAVRRLQEEVQNFRENGGVAVAAANPRASGNGQPIFGQVTGVDNGSSSTLVQLNIGDVDGVVTNQRYMISRGSQLVGRVKIQTVDEQVAVGIVESNSQPIQQGDRVMLVGS